MHPAAGCVLVATPELTHPAFARTVVYLLEHGASGTLGFIINRPLPTPLGELWSEAPEGLLAATVAAEGGPVNRTEGLLLHGCPELPGAQGMSQGCAVGGDLEALAARYRDGADHTGPRLFLGHSGWSPGQLAQEIVQGSWVVRPGTIGLLLDNAPATELWRRLLARPPHLGEPSVN